MLINLNVLLEIPSIIPIIRRQMLGVMLKLKGEHRKNTEEVETSNYKHSYTQLKTLKNKTKKTTKLIQQNTLIGNEYNLILFTYKR